MESSRLPTPEPPQRNTAFNATSAPSQAKMPQIKQEWTIDNRVGASPAEILQLQFLLSTAWESMERSAAPLLSNFSVGAACLSSENKVGTGANFEHGAGLGKALDDATHGEQSAVGDMLNKHGKQSRLVMIAFTTRLESHHACSCGRCRGIIESFAEPGVDVLLAGGAANRTAKVWRLSELLPNDFPVVQSSELASTTQKLLAAAQSGSERGLDVLTSEVTGKTGASVRTDDGRIFSSGKFDIAAYYGISAVGGAIQAALAQGAPRIEELAFISDSGRLLPEDRQFVYEIASALGRTADLPVYLVTRSNGEIRMTTPAGLLPFGFGAADLGPEVESALAEKLRAIRA